VKKMSVSATGNITSIIRVIFYSICLIIFLPSCMNSNLHELKTKELTENSDNPNPLPGVNEAVQFLSFSFEECFNPGLESNITASICDTSVSAQIKNNILSNMVPTFTVTPNAIVNVNGVVQTSGITSQNFTSPVVYNVISESAIATSYTVSVSLTDNPAIEITAVNSYVGDINITWVGSSNEKLYKLNIYNKDLVNGGRSFLKAVSGYSGTVSLGGAEGLAADAYHSFEIDVEDKWGNVSSLPVQIGAVASTESVTYTLIHSESELDNVRSNLTGSYIQLSDLDLSGYSNWNPIGDAANRFT
jgi:hypothetical protein